jgi:hypothetical protein
LYGYFLVKRIRLEEARWELSRLRMEGAA